MCCIMLLIWVFERGNKDGMSGSERDCGLQVQGTRVQNLEKIK